MHVKVNNIHTLKLWPFSQYTRPLSPLLPPYKESDCDREDWKKTQRELDLVLTKCLFGYPDHGGPNKTSGTCSAAAAVPVELLSSPQWYQFHFTFDIC